MKKRKSVILMLGVLLCMPVICQATLTDWEITSGHEYVVDGDLYNKIEIFNDAILDIQGGGTTTVNAYDTSKVNISGGYIFILGTPDFPAVGSSPIVNLTGGTIETINPSAGVVNIHGYDFEISNLTDHSYTLKGKWETGVSFEIYMSRTIPTDPYVVLHTIPEPFTFGLFGFGILIARRSVKTFRK